MKSAVRKSSLLNKWRDRAAKEGTGTGLKKAPEGVLIPLSSAQERLWFLQQLNPESTVYNYSEVYHFSGELDTGLLKEGIQYVYKRNDILRTSYHLKNEKVYQTVAEYSELPIAYHDLSTLSADKILQRTEAIFSEVSDTVFNLETPELMRATLVKIGDKEYKLLITMHHIVTDKWSMDIFREQLASYYNAAVQGQKVVANQDIQYTDYAYRQQEKGVDQSKLEYWKNKLGGEIPVLNLPQDFAAATDNKLSGASFKKDISPEISEKILELSKQYEATPYVVLLSVFYVLLYRYSGQKDILIGSPISNRDEKILQEMIGFFDETIVMRTKLNGDWGFRKVVEEVKKVTLEAFVNKDVPYGLIVKELNPERSLSTNPFFRSMFIYHTVPDKPSFGKDIDYQYAFYDNGVSKFDLTLYVANNSGQLSTSIEYVTSLFRESTIEQFQEHLHLLIASIVSDPEKPIDDLRMIGVIELQMLEPDIHTGDLWKEYLGIHQVIEDIGSSRYNDTAVILGDSRMTYGELLKQSENIARHIVSRTEGSNDVVGLCMDKSPAMIAALLGVLRAGCAYLPLDPEYPKDRTGYVLEDSGCRLVITTEDLEDQFENFQGKLMMISDIIATDELDHIKLPEADPENLAYLIYTSGSTGKPKGVPIRHRNIMESTKGRLTYYTESPTNFLLLSSIAFDSSKAGLYWTLCTGGCLVLTETRAEQDIEMLSRLIGDLNITHTLMLPSLYQMLLNYGNVDELSSLNTVIVAGEACPTSLAAKHFETLSGASLYNEYGPTEATVWCIAHKITKEDLTGNIPIGKAVANATIYLLDDKNRAVPYGATGEICVGGPGLSGLYLNRPELSQDAYFSYEDHKGDKVLLYRTGDLGRYRYDGNIEFYGRADKQVKIRGFRVELEEVENVIRRIEGVRDVVTLISATKESVTTKLFAFVISESSKGEDYYKSYLSGKLPGYMVPSRIIEIREIPRLPNGKTDGKALEQMVESNLNTGHRTLTKPRNKVEEKLIAIWEEVLQVRPLDIHDNFFELGGDSISSIQILAKARNTGLLLQPNHIFQHQTVAELAMFAETKEVAEESALIQSKELGLTPIQSWFFEEHRHAPHYWNQVAKLQHWDLSIEALKALMSKLVEYHESLRLAFSRKDGSWQARILPPEAHETTFIYELNSASEEAQKEEIKNILIDHQASKSLEEGGLFRAIVFDKGEGHKPEIYLVAHHLVVDIVSWNIILDDLKDGMTSMKGGKEISLHGKATNISDWVSYLGQIASSEALNSEIDFWNSQYIPLKKEKLGLQSGPSEITTREILLQNVNWTESDSEPLKDSIHKAYNTKIEDILITALVETIAQWSGQEQVSIGLERHGRNITDSAIDLSRTTGWFTSFFPVKFTRIADGDTGSQIKDIKEKLRNIPRDGMGYGVLNYMSGLAEREGVEKGFPEIVFNFLGSSREDSENNSLSYELLWENVRDPGSESKYLIELNTRIHNSQLQLFWSFSGRHFSQELIDKLINDFNVNLKKIIDHCLQDNASGFTASDFPEAEISQSELDKLLKGLQG